MIQTGFYVTALAGEGLHALLCLDSKLAPGGEDSW